jgi:hypothetical protein
MSYVTEDLQPVLNFPQAVIVFPSDLICLKNTYIIPAILTVRLLIIAGLGIIL